jgi:pilin isopeptide linkage protein/uncharacterized repeat protein (TIGR02543 family)
MHRVIVTLLCCALVLSTFPTDSLAQAMVKLSNASEEISDTSSSSNRQDSASLADMTLDRNSASGQSDPIRTVIFDGNGATVGEMENLDLTQDVQTLPIHTFERDGYRFLGWSTTTDGKDETTEPKRAALAVPDQAELTGWTYAWDADNNGAIDKDTEEFDLSAWVQAAQDRSHETVVLYAQWEAAEDMDSNADNQAVSFDEAAVSAIKTDTGTQDVDEKGANLVEGDAQSNDQLDKLPSNMSATRAQSDLQMSHEEDADIRDIDGGAGEHLALLIQEGLSLPWASRATRRARSISSLLASEVSTAASADGSSIDKVSLAWVTKDSKGREDNDEQRLLLAPTDNSPLAVTARLSASFSGEYSYSPGSLRIRIPSHIFTTRTGEAVGTMVLPLAKAPSTRTDFNWQLVGNEYVLTNTRTLDAGSQLTLEFSFENITPSDLVDAYKDDGSPTNLDNATTQDLDITVELTTHAGTLLSSTTNSLTAQVDTQEKMSSANKAYYRHTSRTAAELKAAGYVLPKKADGSEYEDADSFLVVTWYTYAYRSGNTDFSTSFTDTPTGTLADGSEASCFELRVGDTPLHIVDNDIWEEDGNTTYQYVDIAYPMDQFVKLENKANTLSNVAAWTLTETDSRDTSKAEAHASFTYTYHKPAYQPTSGAMNLDKWGVSSDKKMTTYSDSDDVPESSRVLAGIYGNYAGGYYGRYADGINRLLNGQAVQVNYFTQLADWGLNYLTSKENPTSLSDLMDRRITSTVTDGAVGYSATGENYTSLRPQTDYTFDSLTLYRPRVYKAVAYDGRGLAEGEQVSIDGLPVYYAAGKIATSGMYGFGYVRDTNTAHTPEFVVEYTTDGTAWALLKTISWNNNQITQTVKLPEATRAWRVRYTYGKTTGDETVIAAVTGSRVQATMTLKPTDTTKQIARDSQKQDSISYVKNTAQGSAVVTDTSGTSKQIFSQDRDGIDRLEGFSDGIRVLPEKSSSVNVDNQNQEVQLTYTVRVQQQSDATSQEAWEQATGSGALPADKAGTFYDLLPSGVTVDMSTIKLRENDRITSAYTIPNYKGSNRTLLVVNAVLTPTAEAYERSGDTKTTYYEDVPRLTFSATYPFEEYAVRGQHLHNVAAYESGNDSLGTVENYCAEADNPRGTSGLYGNTTTALAFETDAELNTMTDLDPDADNANFVYAGDVASYSVNNFSISNASKRVMVNSDGIWATGVTGTSDATDAQERIAYAGSLYTYRLAVAPLTGGLSNIVIYDAIEAYTPTQDKVDAGDKTWKGQLVSVDTTALEAAGVAPVVWYYTGEEISDSTDIQSAADSTKISDAAVLPQDGHDANGWTTTLPEDTRRVKAIVIDCSAAQNGGAYTLSPGNSLAAYVNMRAPQGEAAAPYISKDAGGSLEASDDPVGEGDGAHAYNNLYIYALDSASQSSGGEPRLMRIDYTKVGLVPMSISVSKKWNDADDQDALRPSSVVVHLLRNGEDTKESATLSEENNWSAIFSPLDATDEDGVAYAYTFVEDDVPQGYTNSVSYTDATHVVLTNTHIPASVSVSGTKRWEGDNESIRPEAVHVQLLQDGEAYKDMWISPDINGIWSYSFDSLPRYHNVSGEQKEYAYSVKELAAADYIKTYNTSVQDVGDNQLITTDITNTYHPYGDLALSKAVTGTQDSAKQFRFKVTLTAADGSDVADTFTYSVANADKTDATPLDATFTNGQIVSLSAGQTLTIHNLPQGVTYLVSEQPTSGYTADQKTRSGKINANTTAQAAFINQYQASGKVSVQATKVLTGKNLEANKYAFQILDEQGQVVSTGLNDADGSVTFGAIAYTQVDNGTTRYYTIRESIPSGAVELSNGTYTYKGTTYSNAVYTMVVTPKDNGDGTMTCTPTFYEGAQSADTIDQATRLSDVSDLKFTNDYSAQGTTTLVAYKTIDGAPLTEGQFSFQLVDVDDAQNVSVSNLPTATVANDADGTIQMPLKFTQDNLAITDANGNITGYETKTFLYKAEEVVPEGATKDDQGYYVQDDDQVRYSSQVFYWHITVSDNGDGTLGITSQRVQKTDDGSYTVVTDAPVFKNSMKDGSLAIQKTVSNPTDEGVDPNQEFTFKVKVNFPDGYTAPDSLDYIVESATESTDTDESSSEAVAYSAEMHETSDEVPAASWSESTAVLSNLRVPDVASASKSTISGSLIQRNQGANYKSELPLTKLSSAVSPLFSTSAASAVMASSPNLSGSAYAVLESDGTLSFVRSTNTYTSGSQATVQSISGDEYTGTVFTVSETLAFDTPLVGSDRAQQVSTVRFIDDVRPRYMNSWFQNCSNLTQVNTNGHLYLTDLRGMQFVFSGCSSLEKVSGLGDWSGGMNGLNLISAFKDCRSLTEIDLSGLAESGVSIGYITSAFSGCSSLTTINGIEDLNVSACKNFNSLFFGCSNLTSLDLSRWKTTNITSISSVFFNCSKLTSLNVSTWDTSKVTNANTALSNCTALETLDLSSWSTSAITNASSVFANDTALKSVTLGSSFRFSTTGSGGLSVLPTPTNLSRKWQKEGESISYSPNEMASLTGGDIAGTWVWAKTIYTIDFNANGGSGSMADQTSVEGASVALPANTFYRPAYDFIGWNTSADGTGTSYENGATITPKENITLYAQWKQKSGTATAEDGVYTVHLKAGERAVFANLPAGATYQVSEDPLANWVLSEKSADAGTIASTEVVTASFTNTYSKRSISASLSATKTLDGAAPEDNAFSFQLKDSQGNVIQTKPNQGTGVMFDPLSYTAAGTYSYTITEVAGSDDAISYDTHTEEATVAVVDDNGVLSASVAYGDATQGTSTAAAFANKTKPGNLTITKHVSIPSGSSQEEQAQKFKFKVTLLNHGSELTGSYNVNGANETNIISGGTLTILGNNSATIEGLPAGTMYSVEEIDIPSGWTQTSSTATAGSIPAGKTSTASFTDSYEASGSVTIRATKQFIGGQLESGAFTFELLDADKQHVLQAVTNGTGGDASAVTFSPIDYALDAQSQQVGEHTYYIHEVSDASETAIDFDGSYQKVMVMVSDAGAGKLTCAVTYGDANSSTAPIFTNTGHAELQVFKYDQESDDGVKFGLAGAQFVLYQGDTWTTKQKIASGISDDNGLISFTNNDEVVRLDANTSYWLVEETAPDGYNKVVPQYLKTDDTLSSLQFGSCVLQADGSYAMPGTTDNIASSNRVFTLELKDVPAGSLPSTGGMGYIGLYALGATLFVLSMIGLCYRRFRRHDNA